MPCAIQKGEIDQAGSGLIQLCDERYVVSLGLGLIGTGCYRKSFSIQSHTQKLRCRHRLSFHHHSIPTGVVVGSGRSSSAHQACRLGILACRQLEAGWISRACVDKFMELN